MRKIFFTVTNDLSYDQRMYKICSTLASNGYDVTLVGRLLKKSIPLQTADFKQKRLTCFFTKGKLFYLEYNLRLFIYLLFNSMDAICAIDLDTILPCLFASKIKGVKRIYDAHEYFIEMKEAKRNEFVRKGWLYIEKFSLSHFKYGYTVCDSITNEFQKKYLVNYITIRNVPTAKEIDPATQKSKFMLYAGVVNEGRGFEALIPAMKYVNHKLVICGDGNFMPQLKKLIQEHNVQDRIVLEGMLSPQRLWQKMQEAHIGIGLYEGTDLNQYWALPNKFFDYIQAGLPQVTMNYPEIKKINDEYQIAVLINEISVKEIKDALNFLMEDVVVYENLKQNCLKARQYLIWENEQEKLLNFYQSVFSH